MRKIYDSVPKMKEHLRQMDKMNTEDDLLNLLTTLREMMKDNNYDGLYAVVKKFGTDDDLECVDKPKDENSEIIEIMNKLIKD